MFDFFDALGNGDGRSNSDTEFLARGFRISSLELEYFDQGISFSLCEICVLEFWNTLSLNERN